MATRGSALRQSSAARLPAGRPGQGKAAQPRKPPLGVVDRRHVLDRARRRQARVLFAVSGAVVAGALTVAAAGHALVAASTVQADGLQSQLTGALATQQNLLTERATLETPGRVLSLAEHRFKMVAPSGVTYLQPVNPGPSVLQAHESRAAAVAGKSARRHRAR